jgi:hypothetical protein
LKGNLQGLFGFSHGPVIKPGHVEMEQGDSPKRREHLGAKTFSASGNAGNQDPFWDLETKGLPFVG